MNVESRIKWTLYASLLMVSPAILNAARGRLETFDFAKYYIAAFLLAWIGTSILHRVMIFFKFDTARRQIEAGLVATPRRRRADRRPTTSNPVPAAEAEQIAEQVASEISEESISTQ